jgi:HSP90 family molecular chaperone
MYVQELKEEYKPLTKWWKKVLGDSVTSVKVSTRLSTTPCVVVAGKYGQSANMERIMRAQVRIVCVCVCVHLSACHSLHHCGW